MEIWYRARWGAIKPVEVAKYTDKSVWVKGGREMRKTSYFSYHPTWEGAKAALINTATAEVEDARRVLHRRQEALWTIEAMGAPVSANEGQS